MPYEVIRDFDHISNKFELLKNNISNLNMHIRVDPFTPKGDTGKGVIFVYKHNNMHPRIEIGKYNGHFKDYLSFGLSKEETGQHSAIRIRKRSLNEKLPEHVLVVDSDTNLHFVCSKLSFYRGRGSLAFTNEQINSFRNFINTKIDNNIIFKIDDTEYIRIVNVENPNINKCLNFLEGLLAIRHNSVPVLQKITVNTESNFDYLTKVLHFQKQIIMTGPPGTGKTFTAKKLLEAICGSDSSENSKIVQFHPSYNYEDFVRGIQIVSNDGNVEYITRNRVFADLCKRAENKRDEKFVLIIDEINRANLAAVLGELIYALEYRGKVETPYEVDGSYELFVPDNVYIIGTMNTADRSIGHIDYAVRRRFAFISVLPDIRRVNSEYGKELFKSVEALFKDNDHNAKSLSLDFHYSDVQPGHTYFMYNEESGEDEREILKMKFAYQVYPLLVEYYKDGILMPDNDGKLLMNLKGQSISISNPESTARIMDILDNFFCLKSDMQEDDDE